ncbi:MAG TPA: DUF4230 domain-containing protein [Acidisarcina sp.]
MMASRGLEDSRQEVAPAPVRTRAHSALSLLLVLLIGGVLLGMLGIATLARMATHGIWNQMAELATGRPLRIDTSLPTVVNKIQRLQRLETIDYTMDKIVEGDRESAILPDFLAGDKLLLVTHGEVIAGVDMSLITAANIQITGNGNSRRVEVHLPPAQILVVRLDNSKTKVYSRVTGLFVPVDPNLESEVRSKAEDQFKQGALADGILDKARQNAAASVTAMLLGLGFNQVSVK